MSINGKWELRWDAIVLISITLIAWIWNAAVTYTHLEEARTRLSVIECKVDYILWHPGNDRTDNIVEVCK